MDIFRNAETVRLRSIRNKFLLALEDEENVGQVGDGSSANAIWTVKTVEDENFIRLISCYEKYLTASNVSFLPGVTGKRVLQSRPEGIRNSSIDWEPLRDGLQVRLRSRSGTYLRPNGGIPPWRNSITHDTPHRLGTIEKVLWDVEVVEKVSTDKIKRYVLHRRSRSDSSSDSRFNRKSQQTISSEKCDLLICMKKQNRLEDFMG